MNRLSESVEHCQQALKNGRKAQRQSNQKSKSAVLPVLDDLLKKGIVDGRIDPFCRHIVSQDGSLRNDGGAVFPRKRSCVWSGCATMWKARFRIMTPLQEKREALCACRVSTETGFQSKRRVSCCDKILTKRSLHKMEASLRRDNTKKGPKDNGFRTF